MYPFPWRSGTQAAVTFRWVLCICLYYRLLQWKITFDINPVVCAVICADLLAKRDSSLLQHGQRKVVTTWNCMRHADTSPMPSASPARTGHFKKYGYCIVPKPTFIFHLSKNKSLKLQATQFWQHSYWKGSHPHCRALPSSLSTGFGPCSCWAVPEHWAQSTDHCAQNTELVASVQSWDSELHKRR